MKKVLLVLLSSILSCATAKAVLIGYDGFSYANGPLEGNNGGEGWAWQNSTQTQNNIGGVSAWIKYGTGDTLITGGKFYSSDNGSLRDYGADRADAALMNGEGKVYYSIEVTPTGAEEKWFGISSMDQSTERIKFGRVRDSDTNWGIQSRIGSSSWTYNISEISIVMNETVRLVCAIDLDNDMLKLWVNPDENDYDNGADNTADAVRTDFTSTNWTSGLRLASSRTCNWDNLLVTTTWAEIFAADIFDGEPVITNVNIPTLFSIQCYSPVPGYEPTLSWSQVSGPATVTITPVPPLSASATFTVAGTYVFQATDVVLSDPAYVTVYVRDDAANGALIAHWDFESLSSPFVLPDITTNAFDGAFIGGGPDGEPNIITGHISDGAVEFFGDSCWDVDAYTASPTLIEQIATGFTIAGWVTVGEATGNHPSILAAGATTGGMDVNIKVLPDYANSSLFVSFASGDITGNRKLNADVYWHHIAAVYDGAGAEARIYIDGALDAEATVPQVIILSDPTHPMLIGNRPDADRHWRGAMDDLRIYNYPLSGTAIEALAAEGDLVPYVTAGDDQNVVHYLAGQTVPLDGALVVDDGNPIAATLLWTVQSTPDGAGEVQFSSTSTEKPTVTFLAPLVEGNYILRLTADDTAVQTYDEVTINLEVAACSDVVAQGLNPATDVNNDCYVDLADFALLAADWLDCVNPVDAGCAWPW